MQIKEFVHKTITIPFLTKTNFSSDIDGSFSNNQFYDLTIGLSDSFDIYTYETDYNKLKQADIKKMNELIDKGYTATKNYKFRNPYKHPVYNYNNLINYFIIIILWILKIATIILKAIYLID